MTNACAFIGAAIFDGTTYVHDHAVLVEDESPKVLRTDQLPEGIRTITLNGGTLMPGFVDLQVNGGGGVMFNDTPDVATLKTIASAHTTLGTRAILPTLITDTPAKVTAAIAAVQTALNADFPGIIGLHLEGPHLARSRKGAHDADLIRPMTDVDLAELAAAAQSLPNLMITLAPESATNAQITALVRAGAVVFLGHSDVDYETAQAAFAAGASGVTHLFNAMSQLQSRAPGLVGAALDTPGVFSGLIADGIHVHPATIRAALATNTGGGIFLVSDAMATAGSDIASFTLNNRSIMRADGRLTLKDGTLAGADLCIAKALSVMIKTVGDPIETAMVRATSLPAALLRNPGSAGHWPNNTADLIYLSDDFEAHAISALI